MKTNIDPEKIKTAGSVWHNLSKEEIKQRLKADEQGLIDSEIPKRLEEWGPNRLPGQKKISIWKILAHQVLNPLIFILVVAAGASVLIGEATDAIFIFLVILINSMLGAYQEFKAEKSAESLQQLMKIKAHVKRNGKESVIDSEDLVPGDWVILESGNKVPADIRIFEVNGLETDESLLTGESIPSPKFDVLLEESAPVSDRDNMVFAGSSILSGRGAGLVVATGMNTQVGKIAKAVKESASAKPPLILRMERFIKQISIFIVAISVILAVLLRINGMDFATIFFFVVALAVSAIPEGLPVALTVALSIATKRMAKRNVIVRRLNAVESLGSCTVIASDKTGTLTVNQQTAKKIICPDRKTYHISGEGYNGIGNLMNAPQGEPLSPSALPENLKSLLETSVLANEAKLTPTEGNNWEHIGDAMDVALLGLSFKAGIPPEEWKNEAVPRMLIPYESEKKYSACYYQKGEENWVSAKGAVETILDFCLLPAGIDKNTILSMAESEAKEGYRVLAFAGGRIQELPREDNKESGLVNLDFQGLVCFIDPLRPEAKDSVAQCKEAGIHVIMITGDHPSTAGNIARDLGIAEEGEVPVTGMMLNEAGDHASKDFEDLVMSTSVFARVSPKQKLQIVDVLIRKGEFVAVTGDGVNDAPALKRANIGVAMGSGTDVAKETGSMIVADDNFSSIVAGVEEGRFAYDNVRKVIYLLISTGAAEIMLFVLSIIAGLPLPLLAVQLLWLNLVTNGIQDVALAFEAGEPGAMAKPPRKPGESIFDKAMISQTITSGMTMGLITFGLWWWLMEVEHMKEYHARDILLLLFVFLQNFHVFNCRSESRSAFRVPIKSNYFLLIGVAVAQGIHVLSMHIPFMQKILRIEPITFGEWAEVLSLAIPILVVMEVFKFFRRRIQKHRPAAKI